MPPLRPTQFPVYDYVILFTVSVVSHFFRFQFRNNANTWYGRLTNLARQGLSPCKRHQALLGAQDANSARNISGLRSDA